MSESLAENASATVSLPAAFDPAEAEARLYNEWVERGYFTPADAADSPSAQGAFSIVLPPPNVTGALHIGHALDQTIQDAVTRRKRMQGFDTLWLPGMDHAGIATQNVVEKQLREKGESRHDYGREAFVEKVWEWKAESGGMILEQMKRLGSGVDWSRERFTMDAGLSDAVATIFKKLYDDELIYRAERIINWCSRCITALSDIEVEHHDDEGELVELIYGEGDDRIVVATTRVETMLGDTCIAVHPEDERYAHLVGREIELPLVGRKIPVVADEHVDPEFGTGCVKVTPAHDPNDFEIGQRHNVPAINVMTDEGVIAGTGTQFDGMDRFEARVAVREALRELGRVGKEKRPYVHAVGHCSRCDTVVEPRLSLQWFVKVGPLAQASGDAVRNGTVRIHPKELEPRWFGWVDNMHDWCISRQLWWGHRIPVWYGPDGEVVCLGPGETLPGAAADGTAPEGWTQDQDVLDTWFSSALWPFSTLGWPENSSDLQRFYPTSVLVTGYDILFFWVARMMMFGLYAMDGKQPFDTIALHGLVRDQFGKKMSKSRGNVVDPLEWVDKYGADALRFTLARGANPGVDQAISEDWVAGSRNFGTKIFNATKFAIMNGATVAGDLPATDQLSAADRWILTRLAQVTAEADAGYEDFQFSKTAEALYHFFWDEVCDWYLELSKLPINAGGPAADVTRRVLGEVFDVCLRLLHPMMPFVTEELWRTLTGGESLVIAAWPTAETQSAYPNDAAAVAEIEALQKFVTAVRKFRSDQGVKPSRVLPAQFTGLEGSGLAGQLPAIHSLLRLEDAGTDFTATVSVAEGDVTVALDLSGAIDVAAERKRLDKELATAIKEIAAAEAKLANESFLAKAPEPVVEKIRTRLSGAQTDVTRIQAQLDALPMQ